MGIEVAIRGTEGRWLSVEPAAGALGPGPDLPDLAEAFGIEPVGEGPTFVLRSSATGRLVVVDPGTGAASASGDEGTPVRIELDGAPAATLNFGVPLTLFAGDHRLGDPAVEVHLALRDHALRDPVTSEVVTLQGDAAVLQSPSGAPARWRLLLDGDGAFGLLHTERGVALTAAQGGQVGVAPARAGDDQRWRIETDGVRLALTSVATGGALARGAGGGGDLTTSVGQGPAWWASESYDAVPTALFTELKSGGDIGECPIGYAARRFAAWMGFIRDDVRLADVVIPGSHDSGTYSMKLGIGPLDDPGGAVTQDVNILHQLLIGVRSFDIRIERGYMTNDLVIYHGPAHGEAAGPMLSQIRSFLTHSPDEIVLIELRAGDGVERDVADLVQSRLDTRSLAATAEHMIPGVTLGDLRRAGRRLVLLWNGTAPERRPWQLDYEAHQWSSYGDALYKGHVKGIVEHLRVCAIASRAPKRAAMQFKAQAISSPTVSPLPGFHPRDIEARDGPALTDWIASLTADDDVNIVDRDFVDHYPASTAHLIGLNALKGHTWEGADLRFRLLSDLTTPVTPDLVTAIRPRHAPSEEELATLAGPATTAAFVLKAPGEAAALGRSLQPGRRVSIHGGTDLSTIVTGNSGARAYEITLLPRSGIYSYQVVVDGQGPSGLGSGWFTLYFTDESGDTYELGIWASARRTHEVSYNSDAPAIVRIRWA